MVLLIALGGTFEVYDLFFTGYVAPGLFAEKILTPTTTSLFGMTGLASFIFALFAGLFIGTIAFAFVADKFGRRAIFTYSLLWYSACTLVLAFQDTANGVNLWRMISGIGIGVELVTIDTYISELVPKSARGKAFAFQQGIGFLSVPLVALFAWLLVPLSPLGTVGLALGGDYRLARRGGDLDHPLAPAGIAALAGAARAARRRRAGDRRDRGARRG